MSRQRRVPCTRGPYPLPRSESPVPTMTGTISGRQDSLPVRVRPCSGLRDSVQIGAYDDCRAARAPVQLRPCAGQPSAVTMQYRAPEADSAATALTGPAELDVVHCLPHYRQCCWKQCPVMLDDHSAGGIKRHFLDYHADVIFSQRAGSRNRNRAEEANVGLGTTVVCQWTSEDGHATCGLEYKTAVTLARHISSCHLKHGRRTCRRCKKEFSRGDARKRHQQSSCRRGA